MERKEILKELNLIPITSGKEINQKFLDKLSGDEKIVLKDNEGYKYYLSINNLRTILKRKQKNEEAKPNRFFRNNIFTEYNIKKYLNYTQPNLVLLEKEFRNAKQKLKLYCTIHDKEFYMSLNCLQKNYTCPECGKLNYNSLRKLDLDWIKETAKNKWDIIITSKFYTKNTDKLEFFCEKHNNFKQYKSWVELNKIKTGTPCLECRRQIIKEKNKQKFFERMKEIHGNNYIILSQYENAIIPIKLQCQNCGRIFYLSPKHLLNGHGCKCHKSLGEEKIQSFLLENKVDFIREYRFGNCKDIKKLSFDFFIPSKNLCIEYQGIQHYKPIEIFDGIEQFKIQKLHDEIKLKYCEKNNINLFIISYKDNILDKLKDIF